MGSVFDAGYKEKHRKTRKRPFWGENHRPILLSETTSCLTSLFLQTSVTDVTSPKRLTVEKSWKIEDDVKPGSSAAFFYLLPVYFLLCLRLSAGVSGNTYCSAPWEREGTAANINSRPIVTRPLTRPYKDRPLLAPTS